MKRRRFAKILAVAAAFGAPFTTLGNGMRLVSQDGFATARGEAFVATADNPSAIYYNPAGITQIEGNSLRLGIYGIYLDPTFTPPDSAANSGNTYQIKNHYAAAPQTFYVCSPEDSRWSFGAGLYAPYGAAIKWPEDTGFRAVAISGELQYVRFNPVVALKLAPTLSIAGGAMVDYGDIKLSQGLLGLAAPLDNYFIFSGDGWSVGYNVGLHWQPHERISFGGTFRSATSLNFKGKTEFEQQTIVQPTQLPAEMEMQFPWTVAFGVSYRPNTNWNIEVNADYTDWSSFDEFRIEQDGTPPFPVKRNIPVRMYWEGSWLFALGTTRYLEDGWHVSAGYAFSQNSVPDDYYSPLVADLDRHFLSVGTGHRGKRFDFDVAYQFGYGPDHVVTGSQPSAEPGRRAQQNADGTYDFLSHAILVTVGLRF